jgi:hypothetical protein
MKKVCLALGIVAVAAVLVTTASAANRGVEFIDPGNFDNSGPFAFTITSDGSTLGGSQGAGLANCIAWDEDSGWSLVATSDNGCYMSKDGMQWGSALADMDGVEHMSRYNPMTMQQEVVNELPELAPCDFFQSSTFGISGDGRTLAGLGWAGCTSARAITSFDDVPGGTMTRYVSFPADNTRSNRMNGADGDGSLLFGWQDTPFGSRLGARWDDGAAVGEWFCEPDDPFFLFCGEAFRSNWDGSAIVGGNFTTPDTFGISEGWLWTEMDGIRGTGQLPGAFFLDQGFNFAVSEDGMTTGGRFGFGPFSSATLWTEATGIINLNQFLIDQGRTEPFDGWFLVQVNDMSEDYRLAVWAAAPGSFFGNQTVIIDIGKVSVCHAPPGNPENARTLNIGWESVADHVAHGDFLGVCEAAGGGFARSASANEFFGVDPTDECFQRAVGKYMATHSAMQMPTAKEMQQMIDASGNCGERRVRRQINAQDESAPATAPTKRRVRRR